jgi:hypothetical protein
MYFPHNLAALRLSLGLLVGLFIPGYLSVGGLFPHPESLDGIERTGLSMALSMFWIPVVALLLSLTHVSLDAAHLVWALSIISGGAALTTIVRRARIHALSPPPVYPDGRARLYLGGFVLALGLVTWAIVTPNLKQQHLAFSILGPQQQLQGYPYQVAVGQIYPLHLHVFDPQPSKSPPMMIKIVAGGTASHTIPVHLDGRATWEQSFTLPNQAPVRNETVRFLLMGRGSRPLRTLTVHYRIVS